jgi:hypothetical protein
MLKATYDINNDGIVDNSDKLDNQDGSYYLDRTNHTGTQTVSTISDFDTEVSNNPDVVANTAKVSADGSINTHSDVDTSGQANGKVLTYNATSGKYEPQTPASGVTDHGLLSGLSDDDHPQYHNDSRADTWLNGKSTDDVSEGTTNKYYSDTLVSNNLDVSANTSARHTHSNKALLDTYDQTNANITDAVSKKHSHSNQTVLDNTTASFTTADETKLDNISVTQPVNLDQMESDVATNNAKVSNATHTGEVTGDTALTVQSTAISNKSSVASLAGTEEVLVNEGGTLKKTTTQDIADLGGGGGGGTG